MSSQNKFGSSVESLDMSFQAFININKNGKWLSYIFTRLLKLMGKAAPSRSRLQRQWGVRQVGEIGTRLVGYVT